MHVRIQTLLMSCFFAAFRLGAAGGAVPGGKADIVGGDPSGFERGTVLQRIAATKSQQVTTAGIESHLHRSCESTR